jgi:hypothetical protein
MIAPVIEISVGLFEEKAAPGFCDIGLESFFVFFILDVTDGKDKVCIRVNIFCIFRACGANAAGVLVTAIFTVQVGSVRQGKGKVHSPRGAREQLSVCAVVCSYRFSQHPFDFLDARDIFKLHLFTQWF